MLPAVRKKTMSASITSTTQPRHSYLQTQSYKGTINIAYGSSSCELHQSALSPQTLQLGCKAAKRPRLAATPRAPVAPEPHAVQPYRYRPAGHPITHDSPVRELLPHVLRHRHGGVPHGDELVVPVAQLRGQQALDGPLDGVDVVTANPPARDVLRGKTYRSTDERSTPC